jgi:thioredoxin-related protein
MDATTFKNDSIIDFLNRNYHAVKLNAETRDTIRFRNQVFVFRPEYKANEIALSLLSGKMGYPSFVILDENFSMLQVIAGYQTPEQLLPTLQHFAENRHLIKSE